MVSRLVYGTWRLRDGGDASPAALLERIRACVAVGITTFDLADIYGDYECEALFGAALALDPSLRPKIQLVTKCDIVLLSNKHPDVCVKHYDTSAAHIERSVAASLKNLGTEFIDVLLLHRPDFLMDPDEVATTMAALRDSGKVRHFGVSNFARSTFDLLQSRLPFPLVTNQVEVSVLNLGALDDGTLDQCLQHRVRPMAWSCLGGGRLFKDEGERVRAVLAKLGAAKGASIEQMAFAFLLRHPSGILPIVGTNSIDMIRSTAGACDVELTRSEWYQVWEASKGHEVP